MAALPANHQPKEKGNCTVSSTNDSRGSLLLWGVIPLALLGLLLAWIVTTNPLANLAGTETGAGARLTPAFLWGFGLIGLYVGVLPVMLGLVWRPFLMRLGRAGRDFVLALTIGLLIYLGIDTVEDGIETMEEALSMVTTLGLFFGLAIAAYFAVEAFSRWVARRSGGGADWTTAMLIALGIGLHNFGEGLAIGAAYALGEMALGAILVVGFTLHNTTEGLAIVAPLSKETEVGIGKLLLLGLIAGGPTILGAWLGGMVVSPVTGGIALALGAGAIAQVVIQLLGSVSKDRSLKSFLSSPAVIVGLVVGAALMFVTGKIAG